VRQVDHMVPKELDEICQQARATRPADRYSTASDLAADLRAFLRQRRKWSVRRRALPLASGAVAALALVSVGVWLYWSAGGASRGGPAPAAATAALTAPYFDMYFVETAGDEPRLVGARQKDMPVPEGKELVLDVRLPEEQEGFVYLFQYDEGRPPKRLWPVDLAHQAKTKHVQYPPQGSALSLVGDPRRIMFLATVSPKRLREAELKAIDHVSFSLEYDVTPKKPLIRLLFPPEPDRPEVRGNEQLPVLSFEPVGELQKHFQAFAALAFYFGAMDPK